MLEISGKDPLDRRHQRVRKLARAFAIVGEHMKPAGDIAAESYLAPAEPLLMSTEARATTMPAAEQYYRAAIPAVHGQ